MKETKDTPNAAQSAFREIVLGTLVFSVVLGFFNDYTDIIQTRSYSITFAVAIIMQVLTYLTILFKDFAIKHYNLKLSKFGRTGKVFVVWTILFFSKFVYLEAIDIIFGESVEISGFLGLMAIIVTSTILTVLIDKIYERLSRTSIAK